MIDDVSSEVTIEFIKFLLKLFFKQPILNFANRFKKKPKREIWFGWGD